MKKIIAAAIFAVSFSANAELVCTEVTSFTGQVVLACKNVPPPQTPQGQPMPKPPGQKEQQVNPTKPQVQAERAEPVDVPETNFGDMGQSAQFRKEAFAGIAQSAALVPLMPSQGKTTLNLGAANFGGQSALGLTVAHRVNGFVLSGGASVGTSGPGLVRVSAGFEF